MKSTVLTLSIGLISFVLVLQGGFAMQAFGADSTASKAAAKPADTNQRTPPKTSVADPNKGTPKIFFEKNVHDFGPVAPGSTNTCEFKFLNKGTGTLVIGEISKTCGCTVPTLDKLEYASGESGTIKVQYNADKGVGLRARSLYVNSNDPNSPRVELTIRGSIIQKVNFEPAEVSYRLKGDNAGTAEITIQSVDEQPFTITGVKSTSDAVTAEFDPAKKAAKLVLKTKIDPQKMGISSNGHIEVTLTHPECTSLSIPFTVLTKYRFDPPAINILNAEPGKVIQKELWVLNNYDEDFEIVSVTAREGIIKVLEQKKVGNRYKLNLEITPPEPKNAARMFTDTLLVNTKDGEKIDVVCRGFYQRK